MHWVPLYACRAKITNAWSICLTFNIHCGRLQEKATDRRTNWKLHKSCYEREQVCAGNCGGSGGDGRARCGSCEGVVGGEGQGGGDGRARCGSCEGVVGGEGQGGGDWRARCGSCDGGGRGRRAGRGRLEGEVWGLRRARRGQQVAMGWQPSHVRSLAHYLALTD